MSMLGDATPEELAAALYRLGHSHAARLLREGRHRDAVRAEMSLVEEFGGEPWHPETWRGIEDALAGRRESSPAE